MVFGGTSAVAPLWAALTCRLAQATGKRFGLLSTLLYQGVTGSSPAPGFQDVTTGGNNGYNAGPGWDACTGLGTPNGTALLARLATATSSGGEQLFPYTGGTAQGQTINSASSYVTVTTAGGGTATVTVSLAQTNQPSTTFQLYYTLDNGGIITGGAPFTTDGNGNGTGTFTITGLAAGSHVLNLDVNNVPSGGGGNTLYHLTTAVSFTIPPWEQIFPYTGGTAQGQTINSASSYVTVTTAGGGTATVTVSLAQTNQPSTTFQLYYTLDNGGIITGGAPFTTGRHGAVPLASTTCLQAAAETPCTTSPPPSPSPSRPGSRSSPTPAAPPRATINSASSYVSRHHRRRRHRHRHRQPCPDQPAQHHLQLYYTLRRRRKHPVPPHHRRLLHLLAVPPRKDSNPGPVLGPVRPSAK